MITIYDVAKEANVSAMTVSRVINNTGKISHATRERVRAVMKDLNYFPNHTARSLVLQETKTLFLLISDISNPFYTIVARGAEDAANEFGYKLLFGNSDEQIEKEKNYIHTILSTRVDGVIMSPASDLSHEHLEELQQHRVPFVLIDRDVPHIHCDTVTGDCFTGAIHAIDSLVQLGHTKIAMINGPTNVSSARNRRNGFIAGYAKNNLEYRHDYLFETSFRQTAKQNIIENWLLALDERPTAVIAGNNVLAVEMMKLCEKLNLSIPEHLSLVSFDEITPYSEGEQFLSVIKQPAYEFGYKAASLLIDRLIDDKQTAPEVTQITLPTKLTFRRSVGAIKEMQAHTNN